MLGYRFIARGPELRIEHELVEPVVVRLEPFAFAVLPPHGERTTRRALAEPDTVVRFGLADVESAAAHVIAAIAARRRRRVPPLPPPIVQGHLLAARSRGLRDVNPDAHRLQRAVLAVGGRVPRLACERALYAEPWVVSDVTRYRAAACALVALEDGVFDDASSDRSTEARVAAMRSWRALFSATGRTYRSLDRTLMNLPPEVPTDLLPHLRDFELERPLTGRLGLTAVLLHAADRRAARRAETACSQRKILERASEAEIAEAVARIGLFTHRELRPACTDDLAFAVRFLIDYPHPFRGRLDGLVHRTIRWHEGLRGVRRGAPRDAEVDGWEDTPEPVGPPAPCAGRFARRTAMPPIPLPDDPEVEFLGTVARIHSEARLMDNCIASYAGAAVSGDCYLFHVRHGGEHASVEVDPRGAVRQAEGPSNSANRAAEWGAARLAAWGEGLRRHANAVSHRPAAPAPDLFSLAGRGDARHDAAP